MTTPTHIDTLINFLAAQMDGEQVPPAGTAAFEQISAAIGASHQSSDKDLQVFALRVVGAVIARVQGSIAAERALHEFIQPGSRS